MSVKRNGLGRNLSALLGQSALAIKPEPASSLSFLALNLLRPGKYQPRQSMNDASLGELAASIKEQGLLQPLIVRSTDNNGYEIIAGERRWRACQLAGLTEAPVIVREVNDETAMAIALVENLQREDLNPVDEARAMARLTEEFNLTHQQIADLVSRSRASVTNKLRLLSLAEEVLSLLEGGIIDMGHARALLSLDAPQQRKLANLVVTRRLSVRETEKLVQETLEKPVSAKPRFELPMPVQTKIDSLAHFLQSKIQIKPGKKGEGSLVIHYGALTELETLVQKILGECFSSTEKA